MPSTLLEQLVAPALRYDPGNLERNSRGPGRAARRRASRLQSSVALRLDADLPGFARICRTPAYERGPGLKEMVGVG
jgi:hypothetical protein